jgi:hypothetical protein
MDSDNPKYPHAKVPFVLGASAFAILGRVKRSLANVGVSNEEIGVFYKEATSGDYDNLLRVCAKWVTLE